MSRNKDRKGTKGEAGHAVNGNRPKPHLCVDERNISKVVSSFLFFFFNDNQPSKSYLHTANQPLNARRLTGIFEFFGREKEMPNLVCCLYPVPRKQRRVNMSM
jgi:hypothetical protein